MIICVQSSDLFSFMRAISSQTICIERERNEYKSWDKSRNETSKRGAFDVGVFVPGDLFRPDKTQKDWATFDEDESAKSVGDG